MKSKRFNILKFVRYFSFIIFIFITFGTSIFTYTSLTTGPIEFIGMFILLFGTECFKTYSIVEFYKFNFFCKRMIQYADEKDKKLLDKILLKTYRYKQYKRRAISFLLSYILCAVVSIIGNLGFTIVNVESKNSVVNTTYSSNTTILSSKIEQLNNKMKDKEKFEQEKEYYFKLDPTKYLGTIRRYEGFISEANKEIKILNADIEKLQNTKVEITSTVKRTVYQIMSDAIRIPEKVLSFIFLLLLGLIPEIGIIKTAPHPTYERKDRKYKKVRVEKEDNVFPMIPTGASVSDIRLE